MRILITTNTLRFGGAEKQRVVLASGLAERGHSVSIIVLQEDGPLREAVSQKVQVDTADGRYLPRFRHLFSADAVITGTTRTEMFFGLMMKLMKPTLRWAVAAHNPVVEGVATYGRFVRYSCRIADVLVCLSSTQGRILSQTDGFNPARIRVIPNGLALSRETEPRLRTIDSEPCRFAFVGRLVAQKGLDTLLSACELLPPTGWVLTIVGDGPMRKMQTEIAERRYALNVQWRGEGSGEDAMEAADVVVIPSNNEAFPLVAVEARLVGRPIIATNVGALPEICGKWDRLIQPENPNQLAAAMRDALDGSWLETATKDAQRHREQAVDEFSPARMAERYEDALVTRARTVVQVGPTPMLTGGISSVINDYATILQSEAVNVIRASTARNTNRVVDAIRWMGVARTVLYARLAKREILLHVHLSQGGSFIREGGLVLLDDLAGGRPVVSLHGSGFEEFSYRHPTVCKIVLRRAAAILVLTDQTAKRVSFLAPNSEVRMIHNWVFPRADWHIADSPRMPRSVLFVGEVGPRKGLDLLLRAWPRVLEAVPDATLAVAGPCADRALLERLGRLEQAVYLGEVSQRRVHELMNQFDLFVLPSRAEAMPKSILEAMSAGMAIVATDVGAVGRLVAPEYGTLVRPGDPDVLQTALVDLLADDARRERGREFARAASAESFGMGKAKEILFDVYNRSAEFHVFHGAL